jgi:gamma-glutamylcyclotransferase (GGCT)/AIG2-like uncharacterized protein YtfP
MDHHHDELPPGVPTCLLFIYGTLRSGQPHAPRLGGAEPLGSATVAGELRNLGDYPGLANGTETVHGELFRIPEVALERIDELEGCDPDDLEGSLFRRELRRIVRQDGSAVEGWTYVWVHGGGSPIPSGDWLEFLDRTRAGQPPVLWL